ncbi:EF hand domain protein [Ketogulonicigenium robustum]|uniref:EF hand domain protein n=1 Tax=Ketogulonicigenium robustum TaxID=92947 RepID=A0A1W6NYQ8_9RHOB|nr:EF-hand domain-containing protein [Ketogulonicigenium robustum]ARO14157.1 EF hand domain protein [Ketogulonicigenium robustum]
MMKTSMIPLGVAALLMAGAAAAQPAPADDRPAPRMPAFADLDANGDGQLTLEDFAALRAARFAALDTNGDGTISAEEVVAAEEAARQARQLDRAQAMLDRLDANGDGVLQVEELNAPSREGQHLRDDNRPHEGQRPPMGRRGPHQGDDMRIFGPMIDEVMLQHMIAIVDTDGDGAISPAEYAEGPAKLREAMRAAHGDRERTRDGRPHHEMRGGPDRRPATDTAD